MKCDMRLEMVSISKIKFDKSYQRPLDEARVKRIAKNLKHGAAKAVSLSERKDGSLYCYDGQQTTAAFKLAGLKMVPAVIVSGSREQEADWFLTIQENTRRVSIRDAQRAGVSAGNEIALRAQNILHKYGLEISTGGLSAHKTGAIGAIRRYVKQDMHNLVVAMDAIQTLWDEEIESWSAVIIRGMYEVARDGLMPEVVKASKKKKVTPRRVLDVAASAQLQSGSPGSGMGFAKQAILFLCGLEK